MGRLKPALPGAHLSTDFFISYTSADRAWADWIAWELRQAGYSTIHQAWDFRPSANFVSEMKKALDQSNRTIAVYSPNYFHSGFSEDEWTAAFSDRSLVPVRVRDCEIPKAPPNARLHRSAQPERGGSSHSSD